MKKFFRKLIGSLGFLALLATLAVGFVYYSFTTPNQLEQPITMIFPPGTHFTDIADELGKAHVIEHPLVFKVIVFARGHYARFKAGEYIFKPQMSAREVAYMIANGKTVVHQLTIPEGLMTSEVIAFVNKEEALSGEVTLDLKEGELLPETYHYSRGDKRNDVLMRMKHAMEKTLDEAWKGKAENLPLKAPLDAVTLASIVEKETGLASERPRVAAVYINRLNKGMLLQADPTTAYAITMGKAKLDRLLTSEDLLLDSPYNTYHTVGLPPGPIANPGRASILAALHPIQSDELYFVATGSGGHNFARNLEEHEKNVHAYRAQKAKP